MSIHFLHKGYNHAIKQYYQSDKNRTQKGKAKEERSQETKTVF